MSQRVRGAATTVAVWLIAGALAAIGLAWISIWAVAELRIHVGAWAPLVIGLVFFVPLAIVGLLHALRAPAPQRAPFGDAAQFAEVPRFTAPHLAKRAPHKSPMASEGLDIADAAMAFVRRSPLTAVALGAAAGLALAYSRGTISHLLDAYEDMRSH